MPALTSAFHTPGKANNKHIAVVGAGAFGGWTALHLLRNGARVTLLDAWGPGNSRASSGGESRVIRYAYTQRRYVDMTARSLEIWDENESVFPTKILHRSGVLFAGPAENPWGEQAREHLEAARVDFEYLGHDDISRRYPQMNPENLDWAVYEPTAGYLLARRGCQVVVKAFRKEGGEFRIARVEPGAVSGGEMEEIRLSDGSTLKADRYVFACGPWLGPLFPDAIGELVMPTRQEVFFFGEPAGADLLGEERFPVWADFGERVWYGIPGTEHRGFKIADDSRGPDFDPSHGERAPSADGLDRARSYMEYRFPQLKGAPLLEARVCQYEETPDSDFIVDRHPHAENVWLVGGGSGHGYKHGAALGEHVAERVLEKAAAEPAFSLMRFS